MQFLAMSQECSPTHHHSLHELPMLLVLQQQNFKQKVVALLRRFKVSEEVSGPGLCIADKTPLMSCRARSTPVNFPARSGSELNIHRLSLPAWVAAVRERPATELPSGSVPVERPNRELSISLCKQNILESSFRFIEKLSRRNKTFHAPAPTIHSLFCDQHTMTLWFLHFSLIPSLRY